MEENQSPQDNTIGLLEFISLWNQAIELSTENKNQEAIDILDKLLKARPDDGDLYCQKGVCLYNLKSYDEALIAYNKAIELGGPNALIYTNIGYIYSDTEDYETTKWL